MWALRGMEQESRACALILRSWSKPSLYTTLRRRIRVMWDVMWMCGHISWCTGGAHHTCIVHEACGPCGWATGPPLRYLMHPLERRRWPYAPHWCRCLDFFWFIHMAA